MSPLFASLEGVLTEPNEQVPSPLALIAAILGGLGLGFTFIGCAFSPLLCMGTVLSLAGVVLGLVELSRARSGASAEGNRPIAMAGAGMGGGGCALAGCYSVLIGTFFVLYFAMIFFAIALEAAS